MQAPQELEAELCRQILALRRARAPRAAASQRQWLRGCRRAWDAVRRSADAAELLARLQASRFQGASGWRASAA